MRDLPKRVFGIRHLSCFTPHKCLGKPCTEAAQQSCTQGISCCSGLGQPGISGWAALFWLGNMAHFQGAKFFSSWDLSCALCLSQLFHVVFPGARLA